jgi:hypothetical protein
MIYGPQEYAGIKLHTLKVGQGIGQLTLFIKFWQTSSEASLLLCITPSWNQYMAGTSASILSDVYTELPHLETKWIPSLRGFLHTIDASLEVDNLFIPPVNGSMTSISWMLF